MSAETRDPEAPLEESELGGVIRSGDGARIAAWLDVAGSDEVIHAVSRLSEAMREQLLSLLDTEAAAELLTLLPESQAVDALEGLPIETAARIVSELPSDEQVDLVSEADNAEAILAELPVEEATAIRDLSAYDDDVAGGLLITEFLAFRKWQTVGDVVRELQASAEEKSDYDVQYLYVVDREYRLVGVLRLRDVVMSPPSTRIESLMIASPRSVRIDDDLDHLREFFRDNSFLGVPALDEEGRLVGIVRRTAVEAALAERDGDDYNKAQGIIGGDELRTMPLLLRSRRRLAWLSLNIVLNIIAASVIAAHQDTLEAVIALAVFLPIISDMSGCSGNQAVAVTMRELTLGVVRPGDFLRVLGKELSVGLMNGFALGVLIGGVAWVWKGNVYLGLVVGSALMANTILAVGVGGVVPLLLRGLKLDPALASGPILTTLTDMCGFFLVLTIASMMLARLV